MTRSVKVFVAGTSFKAAYGGPAYSVSRLAAALAEDGMKVGLWAPDGSAMDAPIALEPGVEPLAGSLDAAFQSFGAPDLVHDNGLWLAHNHRLATLAHRRRIPRIVSTRGMLEPWARKHKGLKKSVAWPLYQRRDLARCAMLHATTLAEADNLRAFSIGVPVTVIPNGADIPDATKLETLRQTSASTPLRTAVFLGRLYPVKGLPMLVEAWRRVRPSGWRLRIAGPDEAGHRAEIARAVRDAGLDEVIAFEGPVTGDAKTELFASADLFILPTHSESFGMAIAEALAHGVPVLTTEAAPWPELESSNSGWRVAATVEGVTTGLRESTRHSRESLRQMGGNGREFVSERLDWRRIAIQFRDAYRSVLPAKPDIV